MRLHKFGFYIAALTIFIALAAPCHGQDTARYWKGKTIYWVAESYTFYKLNKRMTMGWFERTMDSDDGQKWFGTGRFTEDDKHFYLAPFRLVHHIYDRDSFPLRSIVVSRDTCVTSQQTFYKLDSSSFSSLPTPAEMHTYYLQQRAGRR